jgi:hypothetical protein
MTSCTNMMGWRVGPAAIVGLTAVGMLSGVQLTDAAGCEAALMPWMIELWPPVVTSTPQTVASVNTILSSILILLAGLALFAPRETAEKLLVAELVGFVLYLFVMKGGYAVGFSGEADARVFWYDAVAVEVRLLVIATLLSPRFRLHPSLLTGAACLAVTVLGSIALMIIKRTMFPFPLI